MAEGFLARWARLKRIPEEPPRPPEAPDRLRPGEQSSEVRQEDGPAEPWAAALTPAETAGPDEVSQPPEPDPLPPVESLCAESDYKPFLKPSVPDALRVAALRKAWSTDAEIASFRGFADYDWDLNAPGYGKLLPIDDIERLRDAIFGNQPVVAREEEPPADAPAPPAEEEQLEPALIAEGADLVVPSEPAAVEALASDEPELADRRDIVDRA